MRPDLDARLPGRGMWLSADRNVVNKAVARNLFAKAARAPARVAADLVEQVERLVGAARARHLRVGAARRSGRPGLRAGPSMRCARAARRCWWRRSDGAADGRRKLRRLAPDLPLIVAFSSTELGAALGRESLVHVAVAPGGLAQRLLAGRGAAGGLPGGRDRAAGRRRPVGTDCAGRAGRSDRAEGHDRTTMTDTKEQDATADRAVSAGRPARAEDDCRQRRGPAELLARPEQGGCGRGQAQAQPQAGRPRSAAARPGEGVLAGGAAARKRRRSCGRRPRPGALRPAARWC